VSDVYPGQQSLSSGNSEENASAFIVRQMMGRMAFATVVKVIAVYPGGVGNDGTVDVQQMVNQIDGLGNSTPHGTIYGVPYTRLHGAAGSAIIMDPGEGDLGIAVFSDRDISSVKANRGQANPGSRRRSDMADAMYIGGLLNGTPTQYIMLDASGITVVTPFNLGMTVKGNMTTTVTGNMAATVTGNLAATATDVTMTASGTMELNAATLNLTASTITLAGDTYIGEDTKGETDGQLVETVSGVAKRAYAKTP
jgi:hypothetical protein